MIYDPITRQQVTILARYPVCSHAYRFGLRITGEFHFALVRYGEHMPNFSGGFTLGTERDVDINMLVADDGASEIRKAYDSSPLLDKRLVSHS